jgi:hypothetical protein
LYGQSTNHHHDDEVDLSDSEYRIGAAIEEPVAGGS